ncbi:hypothetical protein BN874_80026 [Candidatus Contendobacter odensis Run_B_J11]|uniref:Uncharacterized protein n=1 Tax=Candidatus Contendobacter odensis Run_B_J11 TaxID=1400861 RepID=A0A7U7GFC0_9GAMM|nr:hypothetical protein BN874_80026 [Candidatus Contendobacter odensis Run_B_J11]
MSCIQVIAERKAPQPVPASLPYQLNSAIFATLKPAWAPGGKLTSADDNTVKANYRLIATYFPASTAIFSRHRLARR